MTGKKEEGGFDTDDRLLGFFHSPFFLSITVGIPFCIYKLIFGALAIRAGVIFPEPYMVLGVVIIIWAALDLGMNITRAGFNIAGRETRIEFCSIAQVGRYFHVPRLFLAIDTLISFTIICIVLWSGWITHLLPIETFFWYLATTLNLVSLSVVIIYEEAVRAKKAAMHEPAYLPQ